MIPDLPAKTMVHVPDPATGEVELIKVKIGGVEFYPPREKSARERAEIDIAKVVHAYDHAEYSHCTYCVFCLEMARNLLDSLPPKDIP